MYLHKYSTQIRNCKQLCVGQQQLADAAAYASGGRCIHFQDGSHDVISCRKVPGVSDVVLISRVKLFHANGPATEKPHWPKADDLVHGTTRSPWPAKRKWRRVETAETGLIIDTRYRAANWWRHFYTSDSMKQLAAVGHGSPARHQC